MIKNKKGVTTLALIGILILAFFIMVFLGGLSFGMGLVDDSMSGLEGDIGNTSLEETYAEILQPGVLAMKTTFPQIISTGVLLGMIIAMLIVGYKRKKQSQIWIMLDVLILIVAEVLAVLIKTLFTDFMNITPEFLAVYRDILPGGAKFILNLPAITPIIGIVIIIATYIITKDKEEDEGQRF